MESPPLTTYRPNITDIKALREELHLWHAAGASEGRFAAPLKDPKYRVSASRKTAAVPCPGASSSFILCVFGLGSGSARVQHVDCKLTLS